MQSYKLRVFLCHSSQDKPSVRELYQKLNVEGWIDVWFDEKKLLPGQDWEYEIEKALDESNAVIVSLSRGSVNKEGFVQRELKFVIDIALDKPEGMIFILPVRLEDCSPPRRLRPYHYVDYFGENKAESYDNLLNALKIKLDEKIKKESQEKSLAEEFNETKEKLAASEKENAELKKVLTKTAPDSYKLEQDLQLTLKEVAYLKNALLANAESKAIEGDNRNFIELVDVLISISQELRHPILSIAGYTDLLLGESVGNLSELQRKFVERIKAATNRIVSLNDDSIQILTLESSLIGVNIKPESVDLNFIIDSAMSYTSTQANKKNISIQLDLPKETTLVFGDLDALQQILIHLLQNAVLASHVKDTIYLKAQTVTEEKKEYVLFKITDSGEGISKEDLPHIFTRFYHIDNILTQDSNEVGVGLSIAKTLTEAQGGRIWVESQIGAGSTFNVLLPIVTSNNS